MGLLLFSLFIFFFVKLLSPEREGIPIVLAGEWKLALFLLPSYLFYFLPALTFLSAILTMGRLTTQNELIGAVSIGMSMRHILRETGTIVLIFTIASYTFSLYLSPLGWEKVEDTLRNLVVDVEKLPVNRFVSSGNVAVYRKNDNRLFISVRKPKFLTTIIGENPEPLEKGLRLKNGNGILISKKYKYSFSFKTLDIPSNLLQIEKGDNKRGMQIKELLKFSKDLKKYGFNPNPPLAEISERFSYPISTFIFFLLSIPIGLRLSSKPFAFSLTFSIIFYLTFFSIYSGLKILSNKGIINPYSGPVIYIFLLSFFTLSLYITHRKKRFILE